MHMDYTVPYICVVLHLCSVSKLFDLLPDRICNISCDDHTVKKFLLYVRLPVLSSSVHICGK